VDLRDDLDAGATWAAAPGAGNGNGARSSNDLAREDAELVRAIVTGETGAVHHALVALAARHVARGTPPGSAVTTLYGLLEAWPEAQRDDRWRERRREIPRIVESAVRKYRELSREAFSACASTLMHMSRKGCSPEDMQTAALEQLAQHGVDGAAAEPMLRRIIDWCERRLFEETANG